MQYRTLGRTGLRVSEIGFGAWAIGGGFEIAGSGIGYGPTDDAVSIRAIERALDLGVNLIDTADAYGAGHSEELIGKALGGRWNQCHIATKVGNERRDPEPGRKNFNREYIMGACERSLKRLRKDVIDLYQLHNPPPEVGQRDEVFETLGILKERGKIRFVGVSITTPEEGIGYIRRGVVDCLQVYYNVMTREAEKDLFPLCVGENIGTLIRAPLKSGILAAKFTTSTTFPSTDHRANWLKGALLERAVKEADTVKPLVAPMSAAEASLRFILNQRAVSTVIVGGKTPEQVQRNCAASDGRGLVPHLEKSIRQAVPGTFERKT
jgi:aryl-alcohol dehydrogenase-like predicted oxidoreductase